MVKKKEEKVAKETKATAETKEVVEEVIETKEEATKDSGFSVKDPQVFKSQELPLIIEPNSGSWKNEEQAEYARTLNGYAYANPKKWEAKKATLLEVLEQIGENPELIVERRGNVTGGVQIKNSLAS